jgi:Calcineurin-like phosphoesterase
MSVFRFHDNCQPTNTTHGTSTTKCLPHRFDRFGVPNSDGLYIFNGDYVDRGAWGVETLVLLAAWKAALPHNVVLLRGNHEARFCTTYYGFQAELAAKYPASADVRVCAMCVRLACASFSCCVPCDVVQTDMSLPLTRPGQPASSLLFVCHTDAVPGGSSPVCCAAACCAGRGQGTCATWGPVSHSPAAAARQTSCKDATGY